MKITLLSLLGFTLLISCNNAPKTENIETNKDSSVTPSPSTASILSVDSLMIPYQEKIQTFSISEPKKIQGKRGTIIYVEPENLEALDGSAPGKTIELHLLELRDKMEMLANNVQTVSDGKLLVSGGAYLIECSSDGKALKLKQGKSMSVVFPKNTNTNMELFYGHKDPNGNMNWKSTGTPITLATAPDSSIEKVPIIQTKMVAKPGSQAVAGNLKMSAGDMKSSSGMVMAEDGNFYLAKDIIKSTDTSYKEVKMSRAQKLEANFYDQLAIQNLGWINCDYFYRNPSNTELIVSVSGAPQQIHFRTFVVFKSVNSIIGGYSVSDNQGNMKFIQKIPTKESVTIMAISTINGKVYGFKKDLNTSGNTEKIELAAKADALSEEDIKSFFSSGS